MEASQNHCDSTDEEGSRSVTLQSPDPSNANPQSSESNNKAPAVNGGSDALAKGLSSILATVIRDFDSKAQATLGSQDQLSSALDRLTRGIIRNGFFIFSFLIEIDAPVLSRLGSFTYPTVVCS